MRVHDGALVCLSKVVDGHALKDVDITLKDGRIHARLHLGPPLYSVIGLPEIRGLANNPSPFCNPAAPRRGTHLGLDVVRQLEHGSKGCVLVLGRQGLNVSQGTYDIIIGISLLGD